MLLIGPLPPYGPHVHAPSAGAGDISLLLVLVLIASHIFCGVLGYLIAKDAEPGGGGWWRKRGRPEPPKTPPPGGGGAPTPKPEHFPNADRVEAWLKGLGEKTSASPRNLR